METYTYVNIDTTKVKEYLELNGYNMSSMSKMLGYSDSYLFNCIVNGKMAADAYKTMEFLSFHSYSNPYNRSDREDFMKKSKDYNIQVGISEYCQKEGLKA